MIEVGLCSIKLTAPRGEPAYLQLYRLLCRDIVSGTYPFGSKLPSKRLLATKLGISLVTVEHALTILCDEGYVGTRERSGYFVTYRQRHNNAARCKNKKIPDGIFRRGSYFLS